MERKNMANLENSSCLESEKVFRLRQIGRHENKILNKIYKKYIYENEDQNLHNLCDIIDNKIFKYPSINYNYKKICVWA